jgi:hypothetical protein
MKKDHKPPAIPSDDERPSWFDRVDTLIAEIEESRKAGDYPDWLTSSFGHLIHKLKAKDTSGRWAYYFVLVQGDREAEFLGAIEGDGTVDLEEYGKVIASCYGEEPTKEVREYLKERYGFEV